jgi:hypothetical protein
MLNIILGQKVIKEMGIKKYINNDCNEFIPAVLASL